VAPAVTVEFGAGEARVQASSVGASISSIMLPRYRSFADTGTVQLVKPDDRLLAHRIVVGADTVALGEVPFSVSGADERSVTFSGVAPGGLGVELTFGMSASRDYVIEVSGRIGGLAGRGGLLLIGLGSGFQNVEGDSADNYRHYGVVVRRLRPENTPFRSLDPGETAVLSGPYDWVAVKSKYFMAAVLSSDSTRPEFGGAVVTGSARASRVAQAAESWVTLPVRPDGVFRYLAYVGPMEFRALRPLGRRLDRASPYGWIFEGMVMPVSTWITQLLIWMHETLRLSYGWVLVLFGVLVRLVLWPLNQKAMKSSVAMQAIQPHLKELQVRHKGDPQRLQQETLKLYREHKVNPLGGCLPMLLPFPILIALFFVFANTIEFRGVPFLWLPDLSRRDPLLIIPVLMGVSMWAVSKLSMAGMPPNPQARMMTTIMPIMMTVLFLNFASGVNLYYAVSNLVSLPQQYLINKARAREMARRGAAPQKS
jgi:YidC/Oxa1 family membrane protein insertase